MQTWKKRQRKIIFYTEFKLALISSVWKKAGSKKLPLQDLYQSIGTEDASCFNRVSYTKDYSVL